MATIEEQVTRLEKRVTKMDMELKEYFDDQRLFIADVENRLGARIDGLGQTVGARIDKMDSDMHAAFARMDAKLSVLIELVRDTGRGRRGGGSGDQTRRR